MPIFARTKITIEEDCMLPRPNIVLNYTGPDPQKIYPKILEILKKNIKVKDANIQEKEFKWDRSSVPEKFSTALEVIKDYDRFTYMMLTIDISGTVKPSKEFGKEGTAKVIIDAVIRTDYPQDTVWERSLIYEFFRTMWHKLFYQDKRYRFREECRETMLTLQNEIKSFFNILPKA